MLPFLASPLQWMLYTQCYNNEEFYHYPQNKLSRIINILLLLFVGFCTSIDLQLLDLFKQQNACHLSKYVNMSLMRMICTKEGLVMEPVITIAYFLYMVLGKNWFTRLQFFTKESHHFYIRSISPY